MKLEKLTKLFSEFIESGQASGVVLLLCTVIAIVLANSSLGEVTLLFGTRK